MKKWMIFAAIVAVFSMVMFSACPAEEEEAEENGAVDGVVEVDVSTDETRALVKWPGADGYEYGVYFQVYNGLVPITTVVYLGLGQNAWEYTDINPTGADPVKFTRNETRGNWSMLITPDAGTPAGAVPLVGFSTATTGIKSLAIAISPKEPTFRIGVAPANPGGFPIEPELTIKWSEFKTLKDSTLP
jgi:hypothetical protein